MLVGGSLRHLKSFMLIDANLLCLDIVWSPVNK